MSNELKGGIYRKKWYKFSNNVKRIYINISKKNSNEKGSDNNRKGRKRREPNNRIDKDKDKNGYMFSKKTIKDAETSSTNKL